MQIQQLDFKEMDLDRASKLIGEDIGWWGVSRTRVGTFPLRLEAGEYWLVTGGEGRILKPFQQELKAGTWLIPDRNLQVTLEVGRELVTTSGYPMRRLRQRFNTFLSRLPKAPTTPTGEFRPVKLPGESKCLLVHTEPGPLTKSLARLDIPFETLDLDDMARSNFGSAEEWTVPGWDFEKAVLSNLGH